jgi:hypothetical protein
MSSITNELPLDGVQKANVPVTPLRAIRISDSIWLAAQETASLNSETVTDVIRRALVEYVNGTETGDHEYRQGVVGYPI